MVPASRPSREPGWSEREAGKRPEPDSLRLLPSGPDRVGERFVRRQTPVAYIESEASDCESRAGRVPALRDQTVPVGSFEDDARQNARPFPLGNGPGLGVDLAPAPCRMPTSI